MRKTDPSEAGLFEDVFNATPSPLFVVDDDVCVLHFNKAAGLLLGPESDTALLKRGGEVLHCLRASETPEGCGRAPECADCPVRGAVNAAFQGEAVYRQRAAMLMVSGTHVLEKKFLVTASPFRHDDFDLALLSLEDVTELVGLRRLIPICANCKKVRADEGYWQHIEEYLRQYLDLEFTHGICPDCLAKYYPTQKG